MLFKLLCSILGIFVNIFVFSLLGSICQVFAYFLLFMSSMQYLFLKEYERNICVSLIYVQILHVQVFTRSHKNVACFVTYASREGFVKAHSYSLRFPVSQRCFLSKTVVPVAVQIIVLQLHFPKLVYRVQFHF